MTRPDLVSLDYARLGLRIQARRLELGWSRGQLQREARLSEPTVRTLERGEPRFHPYPPTKVRLEAALGWSPGTIDRILTGGDPIRFDDPVRLTSLEQRVAKLERLIHCFVEAS